ncbi:oxaloacetate decarboxylase, gamma subunit [Campylobacter pinnipediorum subsp. caledonicus]|uniref:Oxaloacetate decarboxylase, gamma subunit n=1 Tax=Campylobacter pinnipediorum subsp. caledonicus TaxID=1874362 RepID=A0A1S6U8Q4_9BACT|nr:OadG family protein [Campylobacter pinnipediorum]AQW86210.1 oxaloacetate decarboxylase, gamma subunit [Campylobacter pinnipediorum subsp. caledonicus]AQW87817.1 oxaloacetate decarboxylase, gamma subunit [Campylobacter pinnipediorum subsp. caledonicus]
MNINLVSEGFSFMVLGMSSVFLFLVIMIFTLSIQGRIINKFIKNEIIDNDNKTICFKKEDNNELVAAISVAISNFKKR